MTATIRSTAGPEWIRPFYTGTLAQPHSKSGHWVVDGGVIGAGTDTLSNIEIVADTPAAVICWLAMVVSLPPRTQLPPPHHAGDTLVFATPPVGPVDIDLGGTDDDLDLTIPGNGDVNITTGDGDDHVTVGGGDDTIHTGDGDDVVHAGGGDDAIVGGQGGGNDFYDGGMGVIRSNIVGDAQHHCRSQRDQSVW